MRTVTFGLYLCLLTCSYPILGRTSKPQTSVLARVPTEPFSPDAEVLDLPEQTAMAPGEVPETGSRALSSFGAQAQVQLTQGGFGGQLRLMQLLHPWFSLNQTLRYFANENPAYAFERRYGALVGTEVHPWRGSKLSPFWGLQLGGERFTSEEQLAVSDVPVGEMAAGVDLRLNRFSYLALQWVDAVYRDLAPGTFPSDDSRTVRYQRVEVHFTMRWENAR